MHLELVLVMPRKEVFPPRAPMYVVVAEIQEVNVRPSCNAATRSQAVSKVLRLYSLSTNSIIADTADHTLPVLMDPYYGIRYSILN